MELSRKVLFRFVDFYSVWNFALVMYRSAELLGTFKRNLICITPSSSLSSNYGQLLPSVCRGPFNTVLLSIIIHTSFYVVVIILC